jgi:hypothetical protein
MISIFDMAVCLICASGATRTAVDDALMTGVSVRKVAGRFNLSKSGVARHRTGCLAPKLAAAARVTAPVAEVRREVERAKDIASGKVTASPDDILSLTGLMARLARSLERLEGSADTAAGQNLHNALAAVSGQLHKGIETAAKIQGLYAEPALEGDARFQLVINVPTAAPMDVTRPASMDAAQPPTLILDVTPRMTASELPPMPAGFKMPDFDLT